MGDENVVPPSKKRAAGREISRDNAGHDDKEDVTERETGTFKKAGREVLGSRRIVKVGRQLTSSDTSAQSSNPFADIRLVHSTTSETKNEIQANSEDRANNEVDAKDQSNEEKEGDHKLSEGESKVKIDVSSSDPEKFENVEKTSQKTSLERKQAADGDVEEEAESGDEKVLAPYSENKSKCHNVVNIDDDKKQKENNDGADATPFHSFQQLSSSKNAFSGFSSSSFSFGSVSKDAFSFGTCTNGGTSLFGAAGASRNRSEAAFPSMQEVCVETGEENEDTFFTAYSALFEYIDGGWKERGKGEVKLNLSSTANKKSRVVMRGRGNHRLILNAYLYPDMKLTKMDKKGITFACVNSVREGKSSLATYALKFKEASLVETFSAAVESHKKGITENSPGVADV